MNRDGRHGSAETNTLRSRGKMAGNKVGELNHVDTGASAPEGAVMEFNITEATQAIGAIAALGTAAFGLVDASKGLWGGPSEFWIYLYKAGSTPFAPALAIVDAKAFFETLHANWINGVPTDDQKAKAKALIHLGLTPENAQSLAKASGG